MSDAPVVCFEWCDVYEGPNGTLGVNCMLLVTEDGGGGVVRSKIEGYLRPKDLKAAKSLRVAARAVEKKFIANSRGR